MIASSIIAGIIGLICIRLRSDYLAIATIGIAEIIKLIFKNETEITNGPRGINKIPRAWEHFSEERFYSSWPMSWFNTPEGWEAFFASLPNWWWQPCFAATVLLIMYIIYRLLERARLSPWGRMMTAIRENEPAARAAGKNVTARRIEAFVIGAAIMGLAGAIFAQHLRLIEPTNTFDPAKVTFLVWVMLILGGSGNNRGAMLGAFLIWTIWSLEKLAEDMGDRLMKKTLMMTTAALMLSTSAFADVNLGNPMALTGPIPDLVAPMAQAVDLAAQNINDQGGMFAGSETLNILRADSACDPVAAVDAVTKLINVNSVSAIIGPVCSGATIAQAESVSIPAGVTTLSVSASSPAITSMEDGTDLVFRSAASDAYQGVALANLAIEQGIKDIAVSYANDDYNAAIAAVFAEAFAAAGGTVTANEAHEPSKASYRSEVATLGATSDNLALFAYYGSGGITLMRNALETAAFSTFIGADGMLSDEVIEQIGAENMGNMTFTTSASDDTHGRSGHREGRIR